jgi:hypothetical protein
LALEVPKTWEKKKGKFNNNMTLLLKGRRMGRLRIGILKKATIPHKTTLERKEEREQIWKDNKQGHSNGGKNNSLRWANGEVQVTLRPIM